MAQAASSKLRKGSSLVALVSSQQGLHFLMARATRGVALWL